MKRLDMKTINKSILVFIIIYTLFQYYLTNYLEVLPKFFNGIEDILILYLLLSTVSIYIVINKKIDFFYDKSLIIFIYLSIISFVTNKFNLSSYLISINDILRFYIVFILLKIYFDKSDCRKLINWLGIFVVISAIVASYQFITFTPRDIPARRLLWDSGVGFFGYGTANIFSIFNGICFYIFYYFKDISSYKKIIYCIFSIIGLLVGCSKMGIIIFFLLTGIYILKDINIKNLSKKTIKRSIVSLLIIIITAVTMSKYFSEEFEAVLDIEGLIKGQAIQNDTGRLSWLSEYPKSIKTILLGDGPGQVISFAAQKTKSDKLKNLSPNYVLDSRFENDFVMIILEYGIIAFFMYISILKEYRKINEIEVAINYIILVSIVSRVFQTQFTSLLISIVLFIKHINKKELERNVYEKNSNYN